MLSLNISQDLTKTVENLNQDESDSEETNQVEETIEIEKILLFKQKYSSLNRSNKKQTHRHAAQRKKKQHKNKKHKTWKNTQQMTDNTRK